MSCQYPFKAEREKDLTDIIAQPISIKTLIDCLSTTSMFVRVKRK